MRRVQKDTCTRTPSRGSGVNRIPSPPQAGVAEGDLATSQCELAALAMAQDQCTFGGPVLKEASGLEDVASSMSQTLSATESLPKPDSVERWAEEVLEIEREISLLLITYNELKAKLSFARSRHRQTVKARELAALVSVKSEDQDERRRRWMQWWCAFPRR